MDGRTDERMDVFGGLWLRVPSFAGRGQQLSALRTERRAEETRLNFPSGTFPFCAPFPPSFPACWGESRDVFRSEGQLYEAGGSAEMAAAAGGLKPKGNGATRRLLTASRPGTAGSGTLGASHAARS